MQLFPAVLVGGPPHRGKSVLTYNLTRSFRELGLGHYVLRACPDGEGDWAHLIEPAQVRLIRIKGDWSPAWVERICRDIDNRHLPLLVDAGGRPKPWQEPIFAQCTHALLLAATPQELAPWRATARRYGLPILAEIESALEGEAQLYQRRPVFKGRLVGLHRGAVQSGPVYQALVQRLAPHFRYAKTELSQIHLETAPVDLALDLDRLAATLEISSENPLERWQPAHVPKLLDQLPANTPLGVYGRGPNWLLAAVALQTWPAQFYQFDVRLGWIKPPTLRLGMPPTSSPLRCTPRPGPAYTMLDVSIPDSYLDYDEAEGLVVPTPPPNQPLVLGGQLPLWLFTALAITYRHAPLLAVHQPQLGHVVVNSHVARYRPGDLL